MAVKRAWHKLREQELLSEEDVDAIINGPLLERHQRLAMVVQRAHDLGYDTADKQWSEHVLLDVPAAQA